MSLYDYKESQEIASKDYGFYALIMSAMRKADGMNLERLKSVYPAVWVELQNRYNAPAGKLDGDN